MDIRTERLLQAFNASGYSQTELCEKTGITKGALSSYLSGRYFPKQKALERLSNALGVSIAYLMGHQDDSIAKSSSSSGIPDNSHRSIPVFGRIPAGIPFEAIEDIRGYEDLSEALRMTGKEYFALEVQGDSMSPKYMSGDIVIFEQACDCENGEDCAVRINGDDATFKKVIKKADCIILQPLNAEFEPIVVDYTGENKPFFILGVAKEIRRKV